MLYVLLDIENDHYLTDPLGTISKSKFIWMKFILIIFILLFSFLVFLTVKNVFIWKNPVI